MIENRHTFLFLRNVISYAIPMIFLFILIISIGKAEAQSHTKSGISIIIPNMTTQYMSVVTKIKSSLKKTEASDIKIINLSNFKQLLTVNLNEEKLVILVGSKSFDYFSKENITSPYITTLITKSAFNFIYNKAKNKKAFVGGVSIDQPSWRFVSLAKALMPNLKKTALVLGPETNKNKNIALKGLNKFNLDYDLVNILLNDNPVNKLRRAYVANEALIIFPDKKKFNRSLSRWVLTLAYQYKIPVISYSIKYAQAGALASLFSTSTQIGEQTAEIMTTYFNNPENKPKKLVDPKYFDIYLNKSVGNALHLKLPSKYELLKKISN